MSKVLAFIAGISLLVLMLYTNIGGSLPEILDENRFLVIIVSAMAGVTLSLYGLLVGKETPTPVVQRSPEEVRADLLRGSVPVEQVRKEAETLFRTVAQELTVVDQHTDRNNLRGQKMLDRIKDYYHRAAGEVASNKEEREIDWYMTYALLSIADNYITDAWEYADRPREPLTEQQPDGNFIDQTRDAQPCPEDGPIVAGHCHNAGSSEGYTAESTPDTSGGGDSSGGSPSGE